MDKRKKAINTTQVYKWQTTYEMKFHFDTKKNSFPSEYKGTQQDRMTTLLELHRVNNKCK